MWLMWMKVGGSWAVGYIIGTISNMYHEIYVFRDKSLAEEKVHYLNGGN